MTILDVAAILRGPTPRNPMQFAGLGVELVVPILAGVLLGMWGDRELGWTPWLTVVGALLGIGAGFLNFFRQVLPPKEGGPGE